jgi:large conductance mechanosensitive channel protein
MLKEFKEFILRGNVLDMAVGVIIGGAFTAIVTSLTDNILTPLLSIFLPSGDAFDKLYFRIGSAKFTYGAFINSVITFLITAFVVFLLVKAINKIFKVDKGEIEEDNPELDLLTEIRDLLKENNTK